MYKTNRACDNHVFVQSESDSVIILMFVEVRLTETEIVFLSQHQKKFLAK